MKIAGIHHVALNVTDLDESIRFYTDVLGFSVIESRPDFGFPGAWLQAGDQQVHLLAVPAFEAPKRQHYALEIDDIEGWEGHLTTHGVQHRRSPRFVGAGHQVFLRDPTGNEIELNQPDR